MALFRLLDLPQIVICQILREMNFIHVALSSSKLYKTVESMRIKNLKMTVKRRDEIQKITLWTCERWRFFKILEDFKEEEHEKVTIEGHCFWLKRNDIQNNLSCTCYTVNIVETMNIFAKFIKNLVELKVEYDLDLEGVPYFLKYYEECISQPEFIGLTLTEKQVQIGNYVLSTNKPIPEHIYRFILNKTPSNGTLFIYGNTERGFRYGRSLHLKCLKTYGSFAWFGSHQLLNSRFESIETNSNETVTVNVLKQFITSWMNGERPEFQYLKLIMDWTYERDRWNDDPNTTRILYENLNVSQTNHRKFACFTNNFYTGFQDMKVVDFKRNDGVLASIGISSFQFIFVIWKPESVVSIH